jgi:LPXTG-site transpeptidase (sortase) family protein
MPSYIRLSEKDIHQFLVRPTRPSSRGWISTVLLTLILSMVIFLSLNTAAYSRMYRNNQGAITQPTPSPSPTAALIVTATPIPTPKPTPTITKNTLSYAAAGISAPIHFGVTFDESIIQDQLRTGVVHLDGTAAPGQTGMAVLTGHSSNYPWVKGDYNSIFASLHKAALGDRLVVNRNDTEYTYRVTSVYQVKPDDSSVLQAGTTSGIRLITCTPIGTSLRRLIVEAEQISPSPLENQSYSHAIFSGTLPDAR